MGWLGSTIDRQRARSALRQELKVAGRYTAGSWQPDEQPIAAAVHRHGLSPRLYLDVLTTRGVYMCPRYDNGKDFRGVVAGHPMSLDAIQAAGLGPGGTIVPVFRRDVVSRSQDELPLSAGIWVPRPSGLTHFTVELMRALGDRVHRDFEWPAQASMTRLSAEDQVAILRAFFAEGTPERDEVEAGWRAVLNWRREYGR